MEPPGLFRGRGDHPKMGKLKARIYPRDITINIGEASGCTAFLISRATVHGSVTLQSCKLQATHRLELFFWWFYRRELVAPIQFERARRLLMCSILVTM